MGCVSNCSAILVSKPVDSCPENGRVTEVKEGHSAAKSDDVQRRPRSSYAVYAGWMIVIAGLLSLLNGLRTLLGESSWNLLDLFVDVNRYSVCALIIMAFGVVAIVGGISAIRGKSLSLALAGAALGIVGDGVIAFWLSIAAILFLFLSSEDF